MPFVKTEYCEGCGLCIRECSAQAISMEDHHAVIDQEKCIKCGQCISVCPVQAIYPGNQNLPLRSCDAQ